LLPLDLQAELHLRSDRTAIAYRRWLKELLDRRGADPESWPAVLERCEQLVAAQVAKATDVDRSRIVGAADALVAEATVRAS